MPVTFSLTTLPGIVATTAKGIVSYAELVEHIQAKVALGVMTFPELFDARDNTLDLSTSQLLCLRDEVAAALKGQPPGKIAAVTNSAFIYGMARGYATLTKLTNPHFEVFKDIEEVRAWVMPP